MSQHILIWYQYSLQCQEIRAQASLVNVQTPHPRYPRRDPFRTHCIHHDECRGYGMGHAWVNEDVVFPELFKVTEKEKIPLHKSSDNVTDILIGY